MSFWKEKWGYKHSLLIITALIANGFLIELFAVKRGIVLPPFPYNMVLLLIFAVLTCFIHLNKSVINIKKWFISKPFMITSTTILSVLLMMSGYIPQKIFHHYPLMQRLGIFNITSSIPFAILLLLISLSLILAILTRIYPFKFKNIAFLLNHIGILVVFIASGIGSGEVKKVRLNLKKGEAVWDGYIADKPSIKQEMPFALKLDQFILKEYNSELVVTDESNNIIYKCGILNSNNRGRLCRFKGYDISVNEFIPDGFKVKDKYVSVDHVGTSPMANISIHNDGQEKKGIVVRGSSLQNTVYFEFDSKYKLAIPISKPKSFKSTGKYYTPEGIIDSFSIEVNKPFKIKRWWLYQFGYNEKMGKWSDESIIEAVYDPSLSVVYIGVFLLAIGSFFLMFPSKYFLGKEND